MNNILSYCGLTNSRLRASDTDLPVQVDVEKLVERGNSHAVDRIIEVLKEYEPDKAESCDFTFDDLKPATLQYFEHIVYLSKNGLKYSLATPIKYYNTRTIFSYMKPNFQ